MLLTKNQDSRLFSKICKIKEQYFVEDTAVEQDALVVVDIAVGTVVVDYTQNYAAQFLDFDFGTDLLTLCYQTCRYCMENLAYYDCLHPEFEKDLF